MPIRYRIDVKQGIVITTADGIFTDTDLHEHQTGLKNDPDFQHGLNQLIDLQGITALELTGDGLRTVAGTDLWGKGSRRAIVALTDVSYGLSRMFQMLTNHDSGAELKVFKDMAEARRWLGLE